MLGWDISVGVVVYNLPHATAGVGNGVLWLLNALDHRWTNDWKLSEFFVWKLPIMWACFFFKFILRSWICYLSIFPTKKESRSIITGERAGHKGRLIVRSPEMLVNANTDVLACLLLHLLGERTRISSCHLNFRERREFVHCSCLNLLCLKRRWDRFFLSHW
jgi:hypothetical protein